jgi:hypothetical protein
MSIIVFPVTAFMMPLLLLLMMMLFVLIAGRARCKTMWRELGYTAQLD